MVWYVDKCSVYKYSKKNIDAPANFLNIWSVPFENIISRLDPLNLCSAYIKKHDKVVSFNGKDNPISNFFPCSLEAFVVKHRSAEHAFQYVNVFRCGDLPFGSAIQAAQTALDAKIIDKQIGTSEQFDEKRIEIIEEIISEKLKQVKQFSDTLCKYPKGTTFAEPIYDDFWGTGLDKDGSDHT